MDLDRHPELTPFVVSSFASENNASNSKNNIADDGVIGSRVRVGIRRLTQKTRVDVSNDEQLVAVLYTRISDGE